MAKPHVSLLKRLLFFIGSPAYFVYLRTMFNHGKNE
jgi:hypothetical protein